MVNNFKKERDTIKAKEEEMYLSVKSLRDGFKKTDELLGWIFARIIQFDWDANIEHVVKGRALFYNPVWKNSSKLYVIFSFSNASNCA